MRYTNDQILVLTNACTSIFIIVAKSDGKISEQEEALFIETHFQRLKDSQLVKDLYEQCILECFLQSQFDHEYIHDQKKKPAAVHIEQIKRAIALVKRKEGLKGYLLYQKEMLKMAQEIADTTADYWGYGARINNKEQQALSQIKQLFAIKASKSQSKS